MKKIGCLFERDFSRGRPVITETVSRGHEWVLNGEGTPTRKWDGSACMVSNGNLYARLDCKKGKTPPPGAIPCDPLPDPVTGHWPHWVLVTGEPQYRWHIEAFRGDIIAGTYELVGPKVNGNHEHLDSHLLIRHGADVLDDVPRDFAGLKAWLGAHRIEGVVFHHPDGRMSKIRRDDFGLEWP